VHHEGVDLLVILYQLQLAILLLDKEEGRCIGGFGHPYISFVKFGFDEVSDHLIFRLIEWIDCTVYCVGGSFFEFDGMIPYLLGCYIATEH